MTACRPCSAGLSQVCHLLQHQAVLPHSFSLTPCHAP